MQKQGAGEQAAKSRHKLKNKELIAEQPGRALLEVMMVRFKYLVSSKYIIHVFHLVLEQQLSVCFNSCQLMRLDCVWRRTVVCGASC